MVFQIHFNFVNMNKPNHDCRKTQLFPLDLDFNEKKTGEILEN